MSLKYVMFVGRSVAEHTPGMGEWAVILITEEVEGRLMDGWHAVHRAYFLDDEPNPKTISNDRISKDVATARGIADFVDAMAPDVVGIMVHCKHGVSRSAAVAKWIAERYGLRFRHDYKLFNQHVYEVMKGCE